ncbi:MAG: hypothetical protein A7316_00530 [Candidatus Altiarchaeales archaeon WOR_SM1_86-2]|nr:MAG: hypothetical protein A7316_00530 [Candidatus Altiarchaeales archaeon WOR_SM1_86-2]
MDSKKYRVVSISGEDKFDALDKVLKETDFFGILNEHLKASGKKKKDFSIVIKPNIMMCYKKQDPTVVYTDPGLVEHLIGKIAEKGFLKISVVDAQNVFSNWFENRDVLTVAKYAGYSEKNYKIVDLTEEKVPYDYGGTSGEHYVGPTWRDADFRISFAKNKTHFACYSTLAVKNIYGTSPEPNKFLEYHTKREYHTITVDILKNFQVHFGIIDAFWSSDGIMGLKTDYTPKNTKTIIGGENIIAVDMAANKKMGLEPAAGNLLELAVKEFGKPEIEIIGDDSVYKDWDNVPPFIDKISDVMEELYSFSNFFGFLSSEMDTAKFPCKIEGPSIWRKIILKLRRFILRILMLISRFE